MTSRSKTEGRFGKQDFVYLPDQDVYRCPAGAVLPFHYSNVEKGMELRRYWSLAACQACAIKRQCTTSKERRITRWLHENIVEEVQKRLDANPDLMRVRRETVEHPFGTIKARMGATHFLMKRLPNVADRDGLARARLQSDPSHEHHGPPAAPRRDESLTEVATRCR